MVFDKGTDEADRWACASVLPHATSLVFQPFRVPPLQQEAGPLWMQRPLPEVPGARERPVKTYRPDALEALWSPTRSCFPESSRSDVEREGFPIRLQAWERRSPKKENGLRCPPT